jgi:RsiW-degrading membrane proteinase PrsW (M82 family)
VSAVLLVAALMSGGYAVEMLVDLVRPRIEATEPAVSVFATGSTTVTKVTFWLVMASWLVAAFVVPILVARPGSRRVPRIVLAIGLLLPFTVSPVVHLATGASALLVCLPSTAFALWAVRRMQPYRRIPAWLLLAATGWGLTIAAGFGGALNDYARNFAVALFHHPGTTSVADLVRLRQQSDTLGFFNAGIVEELGKAAGIAIVYLALRRYIDDVISGIVLGAAVGLGFNLAETVVYMSQQGGANAAFQYWMRQSIGLMAAHTAFTALVGAAVGAARQMPDRRLRRITIACALLAAIGGHFACDAIFAWYGRMANRWLAPGSVIDALLLWPLVLLLLQGPFILIYTSLVRNGRRSQTAALTEAFEAESRTGAVAAAEVPVLLNPGRRWWLQFTVLRRNGMAAYRAFVRLQAAQYDLATFHWHHARGEAVELVPLREAIRRRRAELAGVLRAPQPLEVGP